MPKKRGPEQWAPVIRRGDTAQGAIQLTGVLEPAPSDSDDVGFASPLPHQPRARAQPWHRPVEVTRPFWAKGLGQRPQAARRAALLRPP